MKPTTLLSLRRWHRYIGVLLAPSILFFSLSGFIQVIGWQDQRDPRPPAWVSWMAGIHKHQEAPRARAPRPAMAGQPAVAAARGGDHDDDHAKPFAPLKLVALLTAFGLFAMTLAGLAIALGTRGTRRTAGIMVAIGVIVPAVLMIV